MFEVNNRLILICPVYRKLVIELRRLEQENGALAAAYGNSLNDQQRAKNELVKFEATFRSIAEVISGSVSDIQIVRRDDPGRNGSGR